MAMGKRRRHAKQASMWVATQDPPRGAAHLFYARLNQILEQGGFDGYVEGLCERFYADDGRPGLLPGRSLRLLLIAGALAELVLASLTSRRRLIVDLAAGRPCPHFPRVSGANVPHCSRVPHPECGSQLAAPFISRPRAEDRFGNAAGERIRSDAP